MHNSLSDMILDITQNAIEADSTLVVLDYMENTEREAHHANLKVCVADNGKGMSKETLAKAIDPFYTDGQKHKNRKVGLGLPFLKQTCEAVGGRFDIDSIEGEGTSVFFELNPEHIDCPPVGNLLGLFLQIMLFEGGHDVVINRYWRDKSYTVTRSELIDALGEIYESGSISLMKQYMEGLEESIKEEINE